MARPWLIGILLGFAVLAAAAGTAAYLVMPIVTAYDAIPIGDRGSAYTLGVRMALTADQVQALWKGETPKIRFQGRSKDMANKYVWQEAKLARIGDCLDLESAQGAPRKLPEECGPRDKLELSGDRLHFKVEADGANRIFVSNKPPKGDNRAVGGAMFGVEGQIGVGRNFDKAISFHVEVDATELDPADLANNTQKPKSTESDGSYESCDALRSVSLKAPPPFSWLPPTLARVCRFLSKDGGKVLSLVLYRSGPAQWWQKSDVVMCKLMLAEMLARGPRNDVVGCLAARWHEREQRNISLVLLDPTVRGGPARLR